MSALLNIKGVVLRGLKNEPEHIKKAVLRVFNEIENDLNDREYEPSDDALAAIELMDQVFIELSEAIDNPEPEVPKTVGNLPDNIDEVKEEKPTIGNLPSSINADAD